MVDELREADWPTGALLGEDVAHQRFRARERARSREGERVRDLVADLCLQGIDSGLVQESEPPQAAFEQRDRATLAPRGKLVGRTVFEVIVVFRSGVSASSVW